MSSMNLTPLSGFGLCLSIAGAFVGSLYLLPRRIKQLPRDDPKHIKARLLVSSAFSIITPLAVRSFLPELSASGIQSFSKCSFWEMMGIRSTGLFAATMLPVGMFVVLYLGVLVNNLLAYSNRYHQSKSSVEKYRSLLAGNWTEMLFPNASFHSILGLRNLVIAPVVEEVVFRSCMTVILKAAKVPNLQIILLGPLIFGVSHLHHFFEFLNQGYTIGEALRVVFIQLLYTSFFGSLEFFIFLRTQHLISICLVHMWCNTVGLPNLSFNFNEFHINYYDRKFIKKMYIIGIIGFLIGLGPITSPTIYGSELWTNSS